MKLIHQALFAICLATAGVSHAQGPHEGRHAGQHESRDPAQAAARMQEHRAAHIAQVREKLNLQASQEAAWDTFVAATAPTPRTTPRPDTSNLTAPARLEHMLAKLRAHETRLVSHLEAVKTFYAVLSPEQQKIFDDSFRHLHNGKRRHHHG